MVDARLVNIPYAVICPIKTNVNFIQKWITSLCAVVSNKFPKKPAPRRNRRRKKNCHQFQSTTPICTRVAAVELGVAKWLHNEWRSLPAV